MMGSLQPQSRIIKKRVKNNLAEPQNFVCGECNKAYKFYPGLYLHIKSKHDGIRPPNTTIIRPERSNIEIDARPGRPKKGERDIDEIDEAEVSIETSHNDLMKLIGEDLLIMDTLGPKAPLEAVTTKILETCEKHTDKWLTDLAEESKAFLNEYKEKDRKMQNLDFDDEFVFLDKKKTLRVIVWFMMWLAKIHVKPEFIPDLCLTTSRIWKVVKETDIEVQDLDNKLVWKKIVSNCESLRDNLPGFKNDTGLLTEFIRRVCQLIGKVFEENHA